MYLYLASNADGFNLALSQKAAEYDIGIPKSTYYDQFRVLENKGYIKHIKGNTYEFFEKPIPRDENTTKDFSDGIDFTAEGLTISSDRQSILSEDREINNNNPINDLINSEEKPVEELYPEEENYTPHPIKVGDFYF